MFKRFATCSGVSSASCSRQSFAGPIGFGIAAMFATEYRTENDSSRRRPCLRTGRLCATRAWPKFDRFLATCPTTSRPRDIPAGNIRQQQADSSPHVSLRKSLRGCGTGATDGPNQADNDSLICFIGRHLGAVLRRERLRTRRHNCVSRMPN